jgi:nitroreductase
MQDLTDKFQERYLAHQKRKAEMFQSNYGIKDFKIYDEKEQKTFIEILRNRRSQRSFNREPVQLDIILELADYRPSSCDRRSVQVKVIESRDEKDLLGGLLVGGTGWVHRADKVLLFLAWKDAYKSPAEKGIMEYIDAGVLAQTLYLICEAMNVGSCYVNPNVREANKAFFYEKFIPEGYLYVGCMALGHYDLKHTKYNGTE